MLPELTLLLVLTLVDVLVLVFVLVLVLPELVLQVQALLDHLTKEAPKLVEDQPDRAGRDGAVGHVEGRETVVREMDVDEVDDGHARPSGSSSRSGPVRSSPVIGFT